MDDTSLFLESSNDSAEQNLRKESPRLITVLFGVDAGLWVIIARDEIVAGAAALFEVSKRQIKGGLEDKEENKKVREVSTNLIPMHWSTILSSSVLVLQSTAFNMSPSFVLNRGVELGKMSLLSTTGEVGESGGASHRASIDVVPSFKVMDMVARANELDEMVSRAVNPRTPMEREIIRERLTPKELLHRAHQFVTLRLDSLFRQPHRKSWRRRKTRL